MAKIDFFGTFWSKFSWIFLLMSILEMYTLHRLRLKFKSYHGYSIMYFIKISGLTPTLLITYQHLKVVKNNHLQDLKNKPFYN